ncbi:T9SS type A sorting domain-containing protein [Membranicola marinus]|uniref:T9SS type A sorting domain-containing protein n=1 Tax=Membranihabitans marinus TaxID=1227546 RepID=A0A953HTI8_9BACT|nr:T9SS type A sorting domain-containing protein [Membranihabitans marinus]MBY5957951.1 T9SS type A sorting domain-containing protein [Membranihabitans marinus]
MKKTNFTTIQPSWCLGANWLKGIIPLLALFVFALPMQLQAQQAPNCSNFSPAIDASGDVEVGADDFVTNHVGVGYPITVSVHNQWGGVERTFEFANETETDFWNVCSYLGKSLDYSVTNNVGTCNLGKINFNGTPNAVLTSAFGNKSPWTGENASEGKVNVYCGYIPAPSSHVPSAVSPCGGRVSAPKVQPDWVMMPNACGEGDTAKVIHRTWEVYDKEGNLSTLTDTIVVLRLPKLTPEAFVGSPEDSFFCTLEPVPSEGEGLKRYAAWKQPVGIHDYELPYTKLQGVVYDLPQTVVLAGLQNAWNQGPNVFDKYLDCVILKKADGTSVTIRHIIDGTYFTSMMANASQEQLTYGFLHEILEGGYSTTNFQSYSFYPVLLLQDGDQILSEGGNFAIVDSDWFYNGHGNNPFWFSGGWPSIYGSGDCISYCDVGTGDKFDCIQVSVPALTVTGASPYSDDCVTICLETGVHCGITIETDAIADWTGSCPQTRGIDSWITQTCWATTINSCVEDAEDDCEELSADDNLDDVVIDYSCTDKAVKAHISQWQTLVDTTGPIFDFCYPVDFSGENNIEGPGSEDKCNISTWDHDDIQAAILAGEQYPSAEQWEYCNPTVYTTGSHDCAAEVYVPSVRVIDNCSGVHSVKAAIDVKGGTRWVALERTNTETKTLANGDICTVYTYSHTQDPIRVPFTGCDSEPIEVRYEAADDCWNQSNWSKYIRIQDNTPPTIVVDRNVNVPLQNKTAWVHAETFDEGSWDNCAIDLRLVRRSDWWADTACVDLCADVTKSYNNWVDILDDLGVNRTQASTAVGGGIVGEYAFNDKYNVNDLKNFLNDGEIEQYYYNQIVWLWEDEELCGEKVVHGWIYAIAEYIAENCSTADEHGNKLNVRELEAIFDNLIGKSGYGNEMSLLGGGWSKSVPFKCEDACEAVPVELLVMDYCCNWGKGTSKAYVEDAGNTRLVKRLPDLNISCEAYSIYYKDAVEAAGALGEYGSKKDTSGLFDELNESFGSYVKTWVDNQNRPTDIDGNLLPESSLYFDYWNVTCEEKSNIEKVAIENHDGTIGWETITHITTFLDSAELSAPHGIIGINCAATCEQDIWVDLDECGQGTITRRFFVEGGCGSESQKWTVEQVINVQSACGMSKNMFDLPANVGTKDAPICLPEELSTSFFPDTLGDVTLKSHLVGKLCNSPAVGKTIQEYDVVGAPGMKKYIIKWNVIDWCASHTSTTREFTYEQEVIATIDADCDVTVTDTTGDLSLVQGTIRTEEGTPVQKVEMKAVFANGSPLTTVTGGEGAYNFSINDGSQVSLVPSKNTGFANGVSTQDLIAIQRHVLQKQSLDSKYQRIAADVDGNGSINGFDVLELRKLVMQPHTKFANNTSWRFFDTQSDKEVYDVANLEGDMNVDFVGVKIGDVNLSGDPARSSRSATGTLNLNVADKTMKSGEVYRIDVTSDNFANINGLQYTLSYVTNLVEIESIEAGALNITKDNYVRYASGMITSSWSEADGQNLSSDDVLFTLVVKAKSEVQLRDALSLNNRVTTTEAYDAEGGLKNVSLRFDGQDSGFALYQNTPNPYAGQTVIGFKLPEASKATLSVYDVTGKVLKIVEGEYGEGYNEVKLTSSDLNATGVLYYQLDTKTYTATKKMIVIE